MDEDIKESNEKVVLRKRNKINEEKSLWERERNHVETIYIGEGNGIKRKFGVWGEKERERKGRIKCGERDTKEYYKRWKREKERENMLQEEKLKEKVRREKVGKRKDQKGGREKKER